MASMTKDRLGRATMLGRQCRRGLGPSRVHPWISGGGQGFARPRLSLTAPTSARRRAEYWGPLAAGQAAIWTMTRRSEEHTSELQSLMRISYAVFCLKKKKTTYRQRPTQTQ